jgi:hypothetical protein
VTFCQLFPTAHYAKRSARLFLHIPFIRPKPGDIIIIAQIWMRFIFICEFDKDDKDKGIIEE